MPHGQQRKPGEDGPVAAATAQAELAHGADPPEQRDPPGDDRRERRAQPGRRPQVHHADGQDRQTRRMVHHPRDAVDIAAFDGIAQRPQPHRAQRAQRAPAFARDGVRKVR